MGSLVFVKRVSFGAAVVATLGIVLPPLAAGQEAPAPPSAGQVLTPVVRAIAPPAMEEVPSGSASILPGERRTMAAVRMTADESITLDGRLDEGVWMRAVPATNFRQQNPDNGAPATEQTEVRFVYDDDKLYMGVTLFDSEPDELIYYQMGRDGFLGPDDKLQWAIDTFNDGQTAYWWETNPLGSMADALRGANNTNNRRWDGIWDIRTTRSEIGWTIELEVPFRTLNFNPDTDGWGVNFQRSIARKNETSLWMGWLRNQGLNRMANAGLLTGVENVSQGRGLDIKPYVVGTSESFPGRDDTPGNTEAQAGVDLFYNLTPSLRANLTANTDFAQAQVDARQTNLTRFSLLFPEQRDFFLDGSLFFNFASDGGGGGGFGGGGGGGGETLIPFQSRRIGLGEDRTPQRINFGGKLTGQAGAFDVGVLQVQTGDESGNDGGSLGEDFTVVRLKRRMLRESYVGGMYTLRHTRDGGLDDRQTMGVDLRLATATFRGSDNLNATGYFLRTSSPADTVGKNAAFGAEVAYPNNPWTLRAGYQEVQENYEAAVGFTRRTGFRLLNQQIQFSPFLNQHPWIRNIEFGADSKVFLDPDNNRLLTREIDITVLRLRTHNQEDIQFSVRPTYEYLQQDFEIEDGVVLPAFTDYRFTRYRVQGRSNNRKPISVRPAVEWGRFFSGDRLQVNTTLNYRAAPGHFYQFTHEWNRVSLAEGDFTTTLYRANFETQLNPRVSLVNNVQYDTQSAVIGWQARFRWILRPGNDLHLVYLSNWLDDPVSGRLRALDRRLATKLVYTHRF